MGDWLIDHSLPSCYLQPEKKEDGEKPAIDDHKLDADNLEDSLYKVYIYITSFCITDTDFYVYQRS